jgi:hypothetical protein
MTLIYWCVSTSLQQRMGRPSIATFIRRENPTVHGTVDAIRGRNIL